MSSSLSLSLSPSLTLSLFLCLSLCMFVQTFLPGCYQQKITLWYVCNAYDLNLDKNETCVNKSYFRYSNNARHFQSVPVDQRHKMKRLPMLWFLKKVYYYRILSSIVHTFLHWKWCWNIPCALYMEGSWERV